MRTLLTYDHELATTATEPALTVCHPLGSSATDLQFNRTALLLVHLRVLTGEESARLSVLTHANEQTKECVVCEDVPH